MRHRSQHRAAERLLVICPTWVGDTVMAMPTFRALRGLYPEAHITALARHAVKPMLDGCPWIDRIATVRPRRRAQAGASVGRQQRRRNTLLALARRLAAGRFDTAVILPNSFRSALLARMAGIPRRLGYERDGRGFLLTDRLLPRRESGRWVPVPTRDYYLGLARYLGAEEPDRHMALFTRPQDDQRADALLIRAGFAPAGDRPLVLINPGASYGDAKIWFAERFAAVADHCAQVHGAAVAVTGAPNERRIIDSVIRAAATPVIDLPSLGVDLTLLKSIVRRSSLMVTNDTGPRHIAAALQTPVVTIFGPTDPAWTTIDFPYERQVRVDVYCSPCQKKKCPLTGTADELACMKKVTVDSVAEQAGQLLAASSGRGVAAAKQVEQ